MATASVTCAPSFVRQDCEQSIVQLNTTGVDENEVRLGAVAGLARRAVSQQCRAL
jgi:hypothetical protein